MDSCLSDIWLHKDIDSFAQVFHLILTENVSVYYRHSETSATALMIASGRGFLSQVEKLISMGASIHCKSSNGWTALDWAKRFGQTEVVDLLESYSASVESGNLDESSLVQTSGSDLSTEDRELLKAYHHSFDDEKVDLDLIMHLLYNICHSCEADPYRDPFVLPALASPKRAAMLCRKRFTAGTFSDHMAFLRAFQIPPANGQAAAVQALPTDWLIYDEMTRAHRIANIRCCSVVTPVTVALFCGPARLPSNALQEPSSFRGDGISDNNSDSEMEDETTADLALLKLDEWLHLRLDPEAAGLLLQLRLKWHNLFLRRMRAPFKPWSPVDETTVRAVVAVLSAEEQSAGLQQPSGIGQRPRPMTCEELPVASTWRSTNSRKSSAETEFADDSSNAEKMLMKSTPPTLHQPKKYKETNILHSKRTSDDRSDQSSVKSTDSSSYPSPCASPSSPMSGKGSKSPSPRPKMPVRYFIMKSSNLQNIDISQQKGIWSTTPSNERKLNRAFLESCTVYLIFSVQGSGHFQGFARMASEIGCEKSQDWGSAGFGGVFKVEWIQKENIPFQFAHHLLNPWNDNKKVQISRDGQELEPQVGEQLLQLWDRTPLAGKSSSD